MVRQYGQRVDAGRRWLHVPLIQFASHMGYRSHDPLRLSCLLEPLAERRLSYEHHRVAHLYGARSANGPPDTDMILMVLHGGPENPQITHQIRLRLRPSD